MNFDDFDRAMKENGFMKGEQGAFVKFSTGVSYLIVDYLKVNDELAWVAHIEKSGWKATTAITLSYVKEVVKL